MVPTRIAAGSVLLTPRTYVQINPEAVSTDIAEFESTLLAATRAMDAGDRLTQLVRVVELYRGELLSGYYENGIMPEQERLAAAYLGALRHLCSGLQQEGDLDRAVDYAHRAIAAAPWQEELHTTLMRLYVLAHRPADALRQYDMLERTLEEESGKSP